MNDLLRLQQHLLQALGTDARAHLIRLHLLLDPLRLLPVAEDNPDEPLYVALHVVRDCFPDIYLQAIQALHVPHAQDWIETLICQQVSRCGIQLESLDQLEMGIPLPAYGCPLAEDNFAQDYPAVAELFNELGVTETYEISATLFLVSERLLATQDRRCQDLAWVLKWAGGISGNSCLDMTLDDMAECEALSWEAEHVQFALEIIEEANELLGFVQQGLNHLAAPRLLSTLSTVLQATQAEVCRAQLPVRVTLADLQPLIAQELLNPQLFQ
jgi:hypothetical protein